MNTVTSLLGKLGPLAKAIAAAVLPLVSVSLLNGSLDYKAIISAAITAVVVYLVPNKKAAGKPTPPPAPKMQANL